MSLFRSHAWSLLYQERSRHARTRVQLAEMISAARECHARWTDPASTDELGDAFRNLASTANAIEMSLSALDKLDPPPMLLWNDD